VIFSTLRPTTPANAPILSVTREDCEISAPLPPSPMRSFVAAFSAGSSARRMPSVSDGDEILADSAPGELAARDQSEIEFPGRNLAPSA
jgi:hypothetical protein